MSMHLLVEQIGDDGYDPVEVCEFRINDDGSVELAEFGGFRRLAFTMSMADSLEDLARLVCEEVADGDREIYDEDKPVILTDLDARPTLNQQARAAVVARDVPAWHALTEEHGVDVCCDAALAAGVTAGEARQMLVAVYEYSRLPLDEEAIAAHDAEELMDELCYLADYSN